MVLVDSSILLNSQVWVTSGHVGGFSDPLIDDKLTKERFRADKLLEVCIENKEKELGTKETVAYFTTKYKVKNLVPESWSTDIQSRVMKEENVKNPTSGKEADWTEVRKFNLMFTTKQ